MNINTNGEKINGEMNLIVIILKMQNIAER